MNKKKEISKNKLKVAIIVWIGLILYAFWKLFSAVSTLETKLLNVESISAYAKDIGNFHYVIAIVFLVFGIFLGLGLAALNNKEKV